jgi:hypothetical protein
MHRYKYYETVAKEAEQTLKVVILCKPFQTLQDS